MDPTKAHATTRFIRFTRADMLHIQQCYLWFCYKIAPHYKIPGRDQSKQERGYTEGFMFKRQAD